MTIGRIVSARVSVYIIIIIIIILCTLIVIFITAVVVCGYRWIYLVVVAATATVLDARHIDSAVSRAIVPTQRCCV